MKIEDLDELTRAKTRLTNLKAEREELKLKIARGELISIDDVNLQWAENAANVKKKLLSLEAKLPPMLYGKEPVKAAEIIHEEIYEVLQELSGEYEVKQPR